MYFSTELWRTASPFTLMHRRILGTAGVQTNSCIVNRLKEFCQCSFKLFSNGLLIRWWVYFRWGLDGALEVLGTTLMQSDFNPNQSFDSKKCTGNWSSHSKEFCWIRNFDSKLVYESKFWLNNFVGLKLQFQNLKGYQHLSFNSTNCILYDQLQRRC